MCSWKQIFYFPKKMRKNYIIYERKEVFLARAMKMVKFTINRNGMKINSIVLEITVLLLQIWPIQLKNDTFKMSNVKHPDNNYTLRSNNKKSSVFIAIKIVKKMAIKVELFYFILVCCERQQEFLNFSLNCRFQSIKN
jgi:hypothetical protein